MTDAPTIFVDLYRTRRLLKREWRWRVRNAGNMRTMATSGEGYYNRQDCLDAIGQIFGAATTVYVREAGQGNELMRRA